MAQFRVYASRLQMIYIVYAHISSGRTVALRCGAAATPLRHFFATESSTEPQSDFLVMCRAGGLSLKSIGMVWRTHPTQVISTGKLY